MAYEWAKPGVKCCCVDEAWWSHDPNVHNHSHPQLKDICLISNVYEDGKFLELVGYEEFLYETTSFRPLITQNDDVEMFLRLASPSPLERLDRLAEELDSLYND